VEGKSFDAAIVVCKMLLEILPSYDLARENLARTYVNRGVEFARRGLLGKAVEDFDCGLMLRPSEAVVEGIRRNTASVYGNLGVLYSEMKQYEQALQLFQWSLELYPSEVARKNVALAQIAVSAKAKMRAPDEETFRQAMLVGLTRSECLNAYGAALAGLGQLTEARRVLESAIQANPHNEVARRNLTALSSRDEGLVFALGVIRQEIQSPHQHSG
jgi:tetratricopeptide (TPR) repeat protein